MNKNHIYQQKERQSLEKYITSFANKTVQAIVQSRTTMKRKSRSKLRPSTYDWFNIAIEDDPSISEQAKKVLSSQPLLPEFSICVEIQLQTADNERLILETWCLSMKQQNDKSVNIAVVYPSMSVLLKSIIAVSRVIPAYKLAGRQSPDSYTILYRIYIGAPQVHVLGEAYESHKVGEIVTPAGIIAMSVAYRTKMTITPQKIEKENLFMLKSDYFKPDMSPKRLRPTAINGYHVPFNFADKENIPTPTSQMNGTANHQVNGKVPFSFDDGNKDSNALEFCNGDYQINGVNGLVSQDYKMAGAFAPSTRIPDLTSFQDLILPEKPLLNLGSSSCKSSKVSESEGLPAKNEQDQAGDTNANLTINPVDNKKECMPEEVDFNCNANERGQPRLANSIHSECGDFVMVELRPPFADSDECCDLGAFFHECQHAPTIASFSTQLTLEEQVTDITSQLAKFETSMQDFDMFVDSICQVDDQNN